MKLASWVMDKVNDAFRAAMDAGGAAGYIEFYDSDPPAILDGDYGQLLATVNLSIPSLFASSGGVAAFRSIFSDPQTPGIGIPRSFRIRTSANVTVAHGSAAEIGISDEIPQSVPFAVSSGQVSVLNTGEV